MRLNIVIVKGKLPLSLLSPTSGVAVTGVGIGVGVGTAGVLVVVVVAGFGVD